MSKEINTSKNDFIEAEKVVTGFANKFLFSSIFIGLIIATLLSFLVEKDGFSIGIIIIYVATLIASVIISLLFIPVMLKIIHTKDNLTYQLNKDEFDVL
jgi:hypothetical protein